MLAARLLATAATTWSRWTLGAYWGGPDEPLRMMVSYEIFEDETGPHDDRLHLWSQVRF